MYRADMNALPFPTDRWDSTTINPNLPHGNDVWPQLTVPPRLPAELAGTLVSQFRFLIQQGIGKSPLHTFVYNLLSNQYFNNAEFAGWCQQVVDFGEYLLVKQNEPVNTLIAKACELIRRSALAVSAGKYPAILQQLTPQLQNELRQAGEDYRCIISDIDAFRRMPVGYHQQMHRGTGYGNISPQQMVHQPLQQFITSQPMGGVSARDDGRYFDPGGQSEFTAQSWSSTTPTINSINPVQSAPIPAVDIPPGMVAPAKLDDVVIDPDYYRPPGFVVSTKRPYDTIYNPGGVEIKPAHLSGWKRTKNQASPYTLGYDVNQYIMFHVKWPDGLIQEKLVKWEPTMEYLRHELNEDIRRVVSPGDGVVVPVSDTESKLVSPGNAVNAFPEIPPLIAKSELNPVEVKGLLVASTDEENERTARGAVMEMNGVTDPTDIPAHVYHTAKIYPIEVYAKDNDPDKIKEYKRELTALSGKRNLIDVAYALNDFKIWGMLDDRTFRFLDKRLTGAINYVLANNLAMPELNIDSFVADMGDLMKYLHGIDEGYTTVIESQTQAFLRRWLTFVEAEAEDGNAGVFSLVDETINFQTTWHSSQLVTRSMKDGPALLSKETHPELLKAIGMLLLAKKEANQLIGCSVRLITSDGVYLDVIKGWLVKDSLLLKVVK